MGNVTDGIQRVETEAFQLSAELGPNAFRRVRIGEEHRAESDVRGARTR